MAGPEVKSRIRWDESTMRNVRADTCRVAASREEISLLFGTQSTMPPEGKTGTVLLTDRIILSPYAAKQLGCALGRFMEEYESKFGALREARRSTEAARKEKAAALFRLVKKLDVEIGLEHSFKLQEGILLANRFLLGVNKKEIESHAPELIIQICKQLDMPQPMMQIFRQCLHEANYIHLGFEGSEMSCLYKVYLEFWDKIRDEIRSSRDPVQPFLLHLGFKWDAFDNERTAVTRYTWHPWLSAADIHLKLDAILDPSSNGVARDIAENIINIACERIPHQEILYLEVTEDENPRRSFDINVYRAGLQVGELYPLLAKLGQHYKIPHGDFHHLYDKIKTQRFGHLSGGLSREGRDFCTVYYGVEPVFGDRFRQVRHAGNSLISPTNFERSRQIPSSDSQVEKTDELAARLLEKVKGLRLPVGIEHSFKVEEKTFLVDRFLAGFRKKDMEREQEDRILDICREIQMPGDFLESFAEDLPKANIALFGYERSEGGPAYKVYLEFTDRIQEAVRQNPYAPRPFLMFAGFKWDVSDNSRKVVTQYTCFPSLVLRDMADRASRLFCRGRGGETCRIVEGILDLASHRIAPNGFLYFEAGEEGTKRNSFSINLYRAGLRMAEIYPLLLELVRHYDAPKEPFLRMYDAAKTQILGHIAGGIGRKGRDFLTLYYSEKGSAGRGSVGAEPGSWEGQESDGRQQD